MSQANSSLYPQLQRSEWIASFEKALRSKGRAFNHSEAFAIGERLWPSSFLLRPHDVAIHYLTVPKEVQLAISPLKCMSCDDWVEEFLGLRESAGVYLRRREDVLLATCAWETVGHRTPADAVREHLHRLHPEDAGSQGHRAT